VASNVYVCKSMIWRRGVINDMLNAIWGRPAAPLVDPVPKVGLFGNDFQPTPDSVIGDFETVTWTGYHNAASGVNSAANYDEAHQWTFSMPGYSLFGDPPLVGDVAYGWFLTNTAGTEWFAAEKFDQPIAFAVEGDALALTVALMLGTDYTGPG